MKNYNVQNYVRYKEDLKDRFHSLEGLMYDEYSREELITKFMPLSEEVARKFSVSQQASGVLSINDLIQEGNLGLIKGIDKIDWEMIYTSEDPELSLQAFLRKWIKGSIRRAIDINRGNIKIPEYKLIEIRKNNGEDEKLTEMFFNSMFKSLDQTIDEEGEYTYDPPDESKEYNMEILSQYLISVLKNNLPEQQVEILRLFYGLGVDRLSAKEIALKLNFDIKNAHVRISQIKKEAIKTLSEKLSYSEVLDYL
jgi:RNA polymerase sigma factor (sigma-70 family)